MHLKISPGNTKIGSVPNLSLTPGESCVKGVPCLGEGCYALSSYKRFKHVKAAWDGNLEFYKEDPDKFFFELDLYLKKKRPERFRLFVGGDFPDESFYLRFLQVAEKNSATTFLCFTKRYEYNYKTKPDNLQIILSVWPGFDLPGNGLLPWAWLDEDTRRPDNTHLRCCGNCTDCDHKCWDFVSIEVPVVFPKH
jgi:hypothetical protein